MSQHEYVMALNIPLPTREELPEDLQKYFAKCDQKLGMLPNVLAAYSHNAEQLRTFSRFYNTLMFGESGLSELGCPWRRSTPISTKPLARRVSDVLRSACTYLPLTVGDATSV